MTLSHAAIRHCEFCGGQLTVTPGRGRPRRFCSNRCQLAAGRRRRTNARWIKAVEGELHVVSDPPSKQIANAIAEASVIAASFRRLAVEESSPMLAAGCERSYLEIVATLDRNFPGWSA